MNFYRLILAIFLCVSTVNAYYTASIICEEGRVGGERRTNTELIVPCTYRSSMCRTTTHSLTKTISTADWLGYRPQVHQINCWGAGAAALCTYSGGRLSGTDKCYDGYDAVATIVRDTRGRRRYLRRGVDGSSDNAGDEEDEDDDDMDQIFHGACTKDVEDENGETVTLINPECQE